MRPKDQHLAKQYVQILGVETFSFFPLNLFSSHLVLVSYGQTTVWSSNDTAVTDVCVFVFAGQDS